MTFKWTSLQQIYLIRDFYLYILYSNEFPTCKVLYIIEKWSFQFNKLIISLRNKKDYISNWNFKWIQQKFLNWSAWNTMWEYWSGHRQWKIFYFKFFRLNVKLTKLCCCNGFSNQSIYFYTRKRFSFKVPTTC